MSHEHPRGMKYVQSTNCGSIEKELGIGSSSLQRNKKVFKDTIDTHREAFEAENGPLDYFCPTSPEARRCALAFCEENDRAQRMWPETNSTQGVPYWSKNRELIIRLLTHYVTLRAYHAYQKQHRHLSSNQEVDQTSHEQPVRLPKSSSHVQPQPQPQPNTTGVAPPPEIQQVPKQISASIAPSNIESQLEKDFSLNFEKKCLDEIKSLDPIYDNRAGSEEFSRGWLSDPRGNWPSEILYPTIDRRMKRLLLLEDRYDASNKIEIRRTGKTLRNKSKIQTLSPADEKEFNFRLARRVRYHVAQFIRNGFIAHDNKSDRLKKTEAFQRLWIKRSWKHSNALKDAAFEKAAASGGSHISSDTRQNGVTMKAPVSTPVNNTEIVHPEPQRSVINTVATAPEVVDLEEVVSGLDPVNLGTMQQSVPLRTTVRKPETATYTAGLQQRDTVMLDTAPIPHSNPPEVAQRQQTKATDSTAHLENTAPATSITTGLNSAQEISPTQTVRPTISARRKSDAPDLSSSQEKRHKPNMIHKLPHSSIFFENLTSRSSPGLFMTPEPVAPAPVGGFRFMEDDFDQDSANNSITEIKFDPDMDIDENPVVETRETPQVEQRSQAPSPMHVEWPTHEFPRREKAPLLAGYFVGPSREQAMVRRSTNDITRWQPYSTRSRQTTPPSSDDEDFHHNEQREHRLRRPIHPSNQRLVFIVQKATGQLDVDYNNSITYSQLQRSSVYKFFSLFAEKSGVPVSQLSSLMFTFLFVEGNDTVVHRGDDAKWAQLKDLIDVLFELNSRKDRQRMDFKIVIEIGERAIL